MTAIFLFDSISGLEGGGCGVHHDHEVCSAHLRGQLDARLLLHGVLQVGQLGLQAADPLLPLQRLGLRRLQLGRLRLQLHLGLG